LRVGCDGHVVQQEVVLGLLEYEKPDEAPEVDTGEIPVDEEIHPAAGAATIENEVKPETEA